MRRLRLSKTYQEELESLLAQGLPRFGGRVVSQKRNLVDHTLELHIAHYPVRPVDPVLGVCAYPVTNTPFVLLYDHDATEVRVHLIIHASADRTKIDLSTVVW